MRLLGVGMMIVGIATNTTWLGFAGIGVYILGWFLSDDD